MLSPVSGQDRKRSSLSSDLDPPRKRLHAEDRSHSSTAANSDHDDDDDDDLINPFRGIEAFRKEAIYRKLLESRIELKRTTRKLQLHEHDLVRSEKRSALFERFWNLLFTDLATKLADQHRDKLAFDPLPDSNSSSDTLEAQLKAQSDALVSVISGQLSAGANLDSGVVELQQRCHDLADEAGKHKQELFLTQSKLQRAEHSLHETTHRLTKVEHDFVRSQSGTIRAVEGISHAPQTNSESAAKEAVNLPAAQTEAKPDHPAPAPASTCLSTSASAEIQEQLERIKQDLSTAQRESDNRYVEIQSSNEEIKALKLEAHHLKLQLDDIPEERLTNSSAFRTLQASYTRAQDELHGLYERIDVLQVEVAQLREERLVYRQTTEADANARNEELEKMIKSKDADVTRLRSQRDDLNAELTERRQREQVKFVQIEEMKSLVNVKEERLVVLNSQVRRLRLTVAALRGEEAAVKAISETEAEEDQIDKISRAAKMAEDEACELRQKLAAYQATANGANSDSASREYELQEEIKKLKMALSAAEKSSTAMVEEIDRLSTAYGDLENQASNKVMDISRMEDKVLRLVTEKSKADNKFFSAMRAKESIENEMRAALRNVERQSKVIDRLSENEKTFAAQLNLHEKEVSLFRRAMGAHAKKIAELENELESTQTRLVESVRTKALAEETAKDLVTSATDEKNGRKRADERIFRLENDLEKTKRRMAKTAASARSKGQRDSEGSKDPVVEALNALLQCSSCQERYRSKVITKCFHTFCEECVDMRIQTRQRKCPHCGLSFAVSDVRDLYMQ